MKTKILLINLLVMAFGTSTSVFSQDIIFLKTGEEIKSIVNEIDLNVIRFKKVENLKGPVYTLEKSKIFMIKYDNGTKDVFNDPAEAKKETPVIVTPPKVEVPKTVPEQSVPKPNTVASTAITDIDGNLYKTVTIGTQVWMAENLKTTHYRNGDPIPNVSDGAAWVKLTTGALCNPDNDAGNAVIYGKLYNWYAVNDNRNIAPTGWHIPSDIEWSTLTTYLGGESVSGSKLKEAGTSHWQISNTGATNETGFTSIPGGFRDREGNWGGIGWSGSFWTATERDATNAWRRQMDKTSLAVDKNNDMKYDGSSVRCVKDL